MFTKIKICKKTYVDDTSDIIYSHKTVSLVEGSTYSVLIDPEVLYLEQSTQSNSQIHKPPPEVDSSPKVSL